MHPFGAIAFLPGSVGGFELVVLFAIVLILFGPKRLPEVAREMGRTLDRLRRASDQFRDQIMRMDVEEKPPSRTDEPIDISAESIDNSESTGEADDC